MCDLLLNILYTPYTFQKTLKTKKHNSGTNKRINKFTPRDNKVIALKSKIVPVNKIFYLQL